MQLVCQSPEVGLVCLILQITGNFGLFRLSSAASHWVDPLAHLAGAQWRPDGIIVSCVQRYLARAHSRTWAHQVGALNLMRKR